MVFVAHKSPSEIVRSMKGDNVFRIDFNIRNAEVCFYGEIVPEFILETDYIARRDQNHWQPPPPHTDQRICSYEAAICWALQYKQDYRGDFLISFSDRRYSHFNAPNWLFWRVQK